MPEVCASQHFESVGTRPRQLLEQTALRQLLSVGDDPRQPLSMASMQALLPPPLDCRAKRAWREDMGESVRLQAAREERVRRVVRVRRREYILFCFVRSVDGCVALDVAVRKIELKFDRNCLTLDLFEVWRRA
jgi:hypothetical protein